MVDGYLIRILFRILFAIDENKSRKADLSPLTYSKERSRLHSQEELVGSWAQTPSFDHRSTDIKVLICEHMLH
jgi:hypothetical protein